MSFDKDNNLSELMPIERVKFLLNQFKIHGDLLSYEKINKGYINQTYKVRTLSKAGHIHKYILQRVNDYVFHDVEGLMSNVVIVTEHIKDTYILPGRRKGQTSAISLRYAKDGKPFFKDKTGYWRIHKYVDYIKTFDIPDNPQIFSDAGYAFGLFIKCVSDIDPKTLCVTIPDFHNTPKRYEQLLEAIKCDRCGRASEVQKEIEMISANKDIFPLIADKLEKGEIPTRICHNDCNLNNILFDIQTNRPVSIIDLDTVMPSSPLYDYGDSLRIGTNTAKDDEKDLSKVSCNLELYAEYAEGFLAACGKMLTIEELKLLPYASIIITSEDALRFLTDYINGDVYYNTSYEKQNLDRARTQIKLAEDMYNKLPEIKEILNKIFKIGGIDLVL